jgi:ubiquinone/menaquinone biosynthesis C-methylase UbiE
MTHYQSERYKNIYDTLISKLYDLGLTIGLTPYGESMLRYSVFKAICPHIKKGDLILDLCCGTGTLTILLAKLLYKDCNLIGIDLSSGQIAQAKRKNKYPNLRFAMMDANELEFPDDYFDHVLISAALHEMNKSQRLNVLSEVHRVIKKDGILLIFEHHEPYTISLRILYNFYLGFIEKITSYSFEMQRNIFKELKQTGFNILQQVLVKDFLNFFQILLAKK